MSCYEWERGEVRIPAADWRAFKDTLKSALDTVLTRRFELAIELFNHLKMAGKGKRNFDFVTEADRWAHALSSKAFRFDDRGEAAFILITTVVPPVSAGRRKPKMPKKKDFKENRASYRLSEHPKLNWEASLVLDPKTRTAHWSVPENNGALAYAWDHPMGIAFNKALRAVAWKRNSGGRFIGNNEHNRDPDYEGGGGNFVTRRFGPLGDR